MATRRVIVQELVSVDGIVAGPSGELDFFEAVSDYSEVDQDNLSILDSGIVSLSYAVTRS